MQYYRIGFEQYAVFQASSQEEAEQAARSWIRDVLCTWEDSHPERTHGFLFAEARLTTVEIGTPSVELRD